MKVIRNDDGTEIEVPSTQRPIYSNQLNKPRRVIRMADVPLPHPDYEFVSTMTGYLAIAKD